MHVDPLLSVFARISIQFVGIPEGRELCGTFGCHDEIDLTIKDVKERDLLR